MGGQANGKGPLMTFVKVRHSHEGKGKLLGASRKRSKVSREISQETAAEALGRGEESGLGCAVCNR